MAGEQAGRHRMGVVELDDLRPDLPQRRAQGHHRPRGQVAAEGRLAHVEPGRPRPPGQRAAGLADQRDVVAPRGHASRGEEHLVLAASPAPGGIDVEHPHRPGTTPCCSSRSLASFTYV